MTLQLGEAVTLFVEARRGVVSDQTTSWYVSRLGRLLEELGEAVLIEEIGLSDLRQWRAALLKQTTKWEAHPYSLEKRGGLSAHTVDGHWRAVQAFFAWLVAEGELEVNPAERLVRGKRPDVPPKRISREAVEKLLHAALLTGVREMALLRFLLATGVRAGECVGMLRDRLNLADRCVTVFGKGAKSRVVCFDVVTRRTLEAYLEERKSPRSELWLTHRGASPLTIGGLRSCLRKLCQSAGIDPVGPHALRHTFAYEFLRAGGDPDMLRRQLGHTSIKTTYENYVRWLDEDRQQAFERSWLDAL